MAKNEILAELRFAFSLQTTLYRSREAMRRQLSFPAILKVEKLFSGIFSSSKNAAEREFEVVRTRPEFEIPRNRPLTGDLMRRPELVRTSSRTELSELEPDWPTERLLMDMNRPVRL